MSPKSFTFLNATNTPYLSQSDAKLMRAHITKTNFASRREQRIDARQAREMPDNVIATRPGQRLLTQQLSVSADTPQADLILMTPPKDLYLYAQYLSKFWSLVFLDGSSYPSTPGEEAWLQMLVSDTALAEISMALGLGYWSQDASCQEKALMHSCKATHVVIQRIQSETAHTGAVIGAVLSMAIGERLVNNDITWNIHIGGLANLIMKRRSRGICDLPEVLYIFLILDSTNYVFDFPLAYHKRVIDAIRTYDSQPFCNVADICDKIVQLRNLIEAHYSLNSDSGNRAKEIETNWNLLLNQVRALRLEDSPVVQATSLAMELILYLSWDTPLQTNLTHLASELKEALHRLPFRPCLFMDLTSCQLMLGAIAAGEGSHIRAWFVARLRRAVLVLRCRGWARPLEILEKSFMPSSNLKARFTMLWNELDS